MHFLAQSFCADNYRLTTNKRH